MTDRTNFPPTWQKVSRDEYEQVVGALEEARALIETAEQDGYVGLGWREDVRRWASCWFSDARDEEDNDA